MATSEIKVSPERIRAFFKQFPTGRGVAVGTERREAFNFANRCVTQARRNASGTTTRVGQVHVRTGQLAASMVPILFKDQRTGFWIAGVGSTSPISKWVEVGAQPHIIRPKKAFKPGRKKVFAYLMSGGPAGKGPNPYPLRAPQLFVHHPGNTGKHILREAVRTVLKKSLA